MRIKAIVAANMRLDDRRRRGGRSGSFTPIQLEPRFVSVEETKTEESKTEGVEQEGKLTSTL